MSTLKHAEQLPSGEVRFYNYNFSTTDNYKSCTVGDLIQFIEVNHLNEDSVFSHNDSPLGDDDPRYDNFKTVYMDPEELLDNETNWNMVTEAYYKEKWNK